MSTSDLATALNRDCHCITIDRDAFSQALHEAGVREELKPADLHQHLVASVPVFIAPEHARRMQDVIKAIEAVAALPGYRSAVRAAAPAIAHEPPPWRGVFFGYDFHLGDGGPKLIEINTNAGGAAISTLLARAQRACCAEMNTLVSGPWGLDELENHFVETFRQEWRLAGGDRPLGRVAIVDTAPTGQYLYPEFILFRNMLARRGIAAVIAGPEELTFRDGALWHADGRVDLVYNRLTDFYFEAPEHAALREAYLARAAVITPHPFVHALYADKQNLVRLSDASFLAEVGAAPELIATLQAGVPRAVSMRPEDADAMWADRKRWFFKPRRGYGSKAAYRGDKLTKGTWTSIVAGDYIAQEIVPPSERVIAIAGESVPLRLDVRNYTYDGQVQLLAARLYQGQTTNFRTTGGGFAPVYTTALSDATYALGNVTPRCP